MNSFIIEDYRIDLGKWFFVCAPPGKCRGNSGKVYRDGTNPHKSGPEWSEEQSHAFQFKSHRSAARVANKCFTAKIRGI